MNPDAISAGDSPEQDKYAVDRAACMRIANTVKQRWGRRVGPSDLPHNTATYMQSAGERTGT
jgi:hypothetical protein